MTSSFAALFATTDPLLDGLYGEAFTIAPKAAKSEDVNGRRVADSSRAGTAFTGIWSDPHARTFPQSRSGHAENLAGQTGDDRPMVDYVTADLAYRAQLGDVVTRVATGEVYTVGDIDEDDVTRTTLALTAATPGILMALARTALRLAAIAALNADPVITALCAGRVFDSRIDELDAKEPVPLIVVYTEDDSGKAYSANNGGPPFNHVCDLVLELSMRATETNAASGDINIELPETDRELEASLDLLEEAAVLAVTVADTPQAMLIRTAVTRRTTEMKSIRFASADTGAKAAMRLITLTTELKGDQTSPLDLPTGTFAALPDPLRTVAQALDPTSSGYATCVALVAKLSPPTAAILAGLDVTMQPATDFDPANPPSPTGPYPAGVVVADPILAPIDLSP